MKYALGLLLGMLCLIATAQEKYKKEVTGFLKPEVFVSDTEMRKWFVKNYDAYKPEEKLLPQLAGKLKGKSIFIVLGTWCSDSQKHVPAFYKVIDKAGFSRDFVEVLGVNRKKKKPARYIRRYKIESVPTVIVLTDTGKELGRIVEAPQKTIEEDLLEIVK